MYKRQLHLQKPLPPPIRPTDTSPPKLPPLDPQHRRNIPARPLLQPPFTRDEALQTDDPRALFRVEHQAPQPIVRRRTEGVVVCEYDVGGWDEGAQTRVFEKVALHDVDGPGLDSVAGGARAEFLRLRRRERGGVGFELDAVGCAACFEGGLEDDVADAGAEVEEDGGVGEVGCGEDLGSEGGEDFAVDGVGEGGVGAEEVDVRTDGAGEALVEDVFCEIEGERLGGEGGVDVGGESAGGAGGGDEGVEGGEGRLERGEVACSVGAAHEIWYASAFV